MRIMRTSEDLQKDPGKAVVANGPAGAERQINGAVRPGGGAAIVDRHDDGAAVMRIGHENQRAERQGAMRGGKPERIVSSAGRRAGLAVLASVAARHFGVRDPGDGANDQRGENDSHASTHFVFSNGSRAPAGRRQKRVHSRYMVKAQQLRRNENLSETNR
jgi:hypothetical protein